MALTAQPTSALRTGGWENEIVPSLRKRLEKESRMLSKRMSHSSMSDDGNDPHTQSFDTTGRGSTSSHPRPSGIPRPSFQSRSPDPSQHYDSHPQPQPPPSVQKRPRTYSQPYPYDPADDPRADSPAAAANGGTPRPSDLKPTRIPQRARSPSIASHSHSGGTGWSAAGTTLNGHPNGHHDYTAADLWEQQKPQPSPTVPDVMLQRKNSEIMREQAPFNKYGSAASRETIEQVPFFPRSRDSYESEERPFEHWYRGDTARNGGVGELRVGRRQEMLEIANYGHALRERPSFSRGPTPTNVYHAENGYLHGGKRRRADSLGARESFYMEDHDEARHRSVLDEAPLTDVEVDGSDGDTLGAPGSDTEAEIIQTYSYTNHEPLSMPAAAASSPSLITHPTSSIPTPSPGPKKSSESAKPSVPSVKSQPTSLPKSSKKAPKSRNVTPTAPKPGAKKPTLHVQTASSSSAGSAIPPRVRAKSAASPLNTPTRGRGRGGKSPSTPRKTAASPKTPKPASATVAAAAKHRSVGVYPALADTGDDSLADAIPTWTQPKVKGDWDDVVLPAVAKKQGMQEQYEMADGSPKPKPVKTVIEPAPGTFGFDYSKFKPPRDYNPEQIPMDEFGKQTVDFDSPSTDTPSSPTPPAPTQQTSYPPQPKPPAQQQPAPRRPMSPRSESPLAFALYGELPQQQQEQPQPMEQPPQTGKPPTQAIPPPEREEEAGCCAKCVIM